MLLATAALLLVLWVLTHQPVTLPAPAGPYPVGRIEYDWVDQARAQTQQPAFLSQFLIQDVSVVKAHAVLGAHLATAQAVYPVLVLQPGLGPSLPDYTALAEDLASRGYVVVGSTPTYSSAVAAFPD